MAKTLSSELLRALQPHLCRSQEVAVPWCETNPKPMDLVGMYDAEMHALISFIIPPLSVKFCKSFADFYQPNMKLCTKPQDKLDKVKGNSTTSGDTKSASHLEGICLADKPAEVEEVAKLCGEIRDDFLFRRIAYGFTAVLSIVNAILFLKMISRRSRWRAARREWGASRESGDILPIRLLKATRAFFNADPTTQVQEPVVLTGAPKPSVTKALAPTGPMPAAQPMAMVAAEPAAAERPIDILTLFRLLATMIREMGNGANTILYQTALSLLQRANHFFSNSPDENARPSDVLSFLQRNELLQAFRGLLIPAYNRQRLLAGASGPATAPNGAITRFPDFSRSLGALLEQLAHSGDSGRPQPTIGNWQEALSESNGIIRKMEEIAASLRLNAGVVNSMGIRELRAATQNPDISNVGATLWLATAANVSGALGKDIKIIFGIPDHADQDVTSAPVSIRNQGLDLPIKQIPENMQADLLLIVYEAIRNAIEHAFPNGVDTTGRFIQISATTLKTGSLALTISDNGKGGLQFQESRAPNGDLRGLNIIQGIVEREGWRVEISSPATRHGTGTVVKLVINTSRWPDSRPQGGSTGGGPQGFSTRGSGGQYPVSGSYLPGALDGVSWREGTQPIGGIVYRGIHQDTSTVPLPEGTLVPVLNSTATPGMTWSAWTTTFLGPRVALPITPALPPSVMGMTPLPVPAP